MGAAVAVDRVRLSRPNQRIQSPSASKAAAKREIAKIETPVYGSWPLRPVRETAAGVSGGGTKGCVGGGAGDVGGGTNGPPGAVDVVEVDDVAVDAVVVVGDVEVVLGGDVVVVAAVGATPDVAPVVVPGDVVVVVGAVVVATVVVVVGVKQSPDPWPAVVQPGLGHGFARVQGEDVVPGAVSVAGVKQSPGLKPAALQPGSAHGCARVQEASPTLAVVVPDAA